jgi:hypothetical protein
VSNIHAFILGIVASWTPSAVVFALLAHYRGAAEPMSEQVDAAEKPEQRDRDHEKGLPRDEQRVCIPFPHRRGSRRSASDG